MLDRIASTSRPTGGGPLLTHVRADQATIGRALSISKHTVKQHVTNILEKLGVQSRVQAAVYAVRNGLV